MPKMKVYVHYGVEGTPAYEKQSMKLPESWGAKPASEVLKLFIAGYNKKHADAPISDDVHLERPLGSKKYPDELISSFCTNYCDVFCVPGEFVRIKIDPVKAKAQAEKNIAASAARRGETPPLPPGAKAAEKPVEAKEWNMKVHIVALTRGALTKAGAGIKVGSKIQVKIEPHGTIGMLKQRIGLIVGAHPKHQTMRGSFVNRAMGDTEAAPLGDLAKIRDVMATQHPLLNREVQLEIFVPVDPSKEITALSDDEGCTGAEEEAPPAPLDAAAKAKELSDAEREQVSALREASQECAAAGDAAGALEKLTEAIALGAPGPSLLAKRAQMLLKAGRPAAALADSAAALALNPDSCKALKLRGKARRQLGDYEGAVEDLGKAQTIDYDGEVAKVLAYALKRIAKIRKLRQRDEKAAADEAKAEAKAAADEAFEASLR